MNSDICRIFACKLWFVDGQGNVSHLHLRRGYKAILGKTRKFTSTLDYIISQPEQEPAESEKIMQPRVVKTKVCSMPVQVPRCYRVTGKRVVDTSIHTMTDWLHSWLTQQSVTYDINMKMEK